MVCKQEPAGAKPALPGLVKIQINYQTLGNTPVNRAANILHGQWLSKVNHPLADLQALTTYLMAQWVLLPWQHFASQWAVVSITAKSLGGDGLEDTFTQQNQGAVSVVPLPPNAAVCLSWKSGITARGGRGRTYIPGVPSSALQFSQGSQLGSGFTSALRADAVTFFNNVDAHTIGGDSLIMGVPSYYSKCQLRPVPLFGIINDAVVHDRLDTQRRRLGKETQFPID